MVGSYQVTATTGGNTGSVIFNLTNISCLTDSTLVTNSNDSGTGSLRQAIAETCSGGIVTFADSYNIYLDSVLSINRAVTIDATGFEVTVSGDSGNDGSRDVQVFNIGGSGVVTLNQLSVISGSANLGGGIANSGQLTVNNSTISGNEAVATGLGYAVVGGGIFNRGQLIVNNSSITDNSAVEDGGGIRNMGSMTINGSTVSGNSSGTGGAGIYNSRAGVDDNGPSNGASATVINSTIANNSGDGIYNDDELIVNNSTIYNNSGNGISVSGPTIMRNSIVGSNSGGDCSDSLDTNTNNLIEDGSCNPAISGDPLLAPLGDYGGETQTLALMPGSPAIAAGDNATCESSDQRGITRPQDGVCDIGAVEYDYFAVPPVFGSITSQTITETLTLTFTASATDANEDTLTYGLYNPASGMSIDSGTGLFSWTPTESQGPGTYFASIIVSDTTNLTDTTIVMITVYENNQAPVLALSDQSIQETNLLTMTVVATDADLPANTLTYTMTNAPTGTSLDENSGLFSWTPTTEQGPGQYPITFIVTDDGSPQLSASQTITITVYDSLPVLAITKTVHMTNDPPAPGEVVSYTIEVANSGGQADDVTIQDILPDQLEGDDLNWGGTIAENETKTFTIEATIAADAGYGTTVLNTASYNHTSGSGSDTASFSTGEASTSASSGTIFLPIIVVNGTPSGPEPVVYPDLIITDIQATNSDVIVTVKNNGAATVTDAFWVDVYYNTAPALNKQGSLAWGLSGPNGGIPLAAGAEVTLSLSSPYFFEGSAPSAGTSVYGMVDSFGAFSYGNVEEANESNNIYGPVTSGSALANASVQGKGRNPDFDSTGLPAR